MSEPRRRRIAKRVVDGLQPGQVVWDGELPGFGVRCQRKAKSYVLKIRADGRQRYITIGQHGRPWTPEQARREARRLLGELAGGVDPAAARDADKAAPTVAALAPLFAEDHVAKLKPRTAEEYRTLIEKFIVPALGPSKARDITQADIARLHHSLCATPYRANFTLAVASKMFSWAEQHGHRPGGSNPCRHVKKFRERKRERFLSEAELARLAEVLAEVEAEGESPYVVAAIRLLIFTGARRDEIRTLRWSEVDLERACLRLADSKTGQKTIYLAAPALEVLAELPHMAGNRFVICGRKAGAALVNLEKPWRRIRARAGLDDVRLHDLRHSFASAAAAGGLSLLVIGRLLGHTQVATTARYAHLAADPLRAANEAVARKIAAAMAGTAGGGDRAEVVPLHGKR